MPDHGESMDDRKRIAIELMLGHRLPKHVAFFPSASALPPGFHAAIKHELAERAAGRGLPEAPSEAAKKRAALQRRAARFLTRFRLRIRRTDPRSQDHPSRRSPRKRPT